MLELARGLSPSTLQALADLESRTIAVDGGRLKLEWGTLRARTGRDVEDLLWWDGDRLVGFLGLYSFGSPAVELVGMVDPRFRRRGIATALLESAEVLCRERGLEHRLLVTPRSSAGARDLALGRGGVLEHSEHALVLTGAPTPGPADELVRLRPAGAADVPEVARLCAAAFGGDPAQELARTTADLSSSGAGRRTLVVERAGTVVGTVRLTRDGTDGGVYGFAVDPPWQGHGIGRDALDRKSVV